MPPTLFDPGLEGVTVAETELSRLDESGDLLVRGYPIEELAANASYEEAVFLLFHGRLPTVEERDTFRADLADVRSLPDPVHAVIARAADEGRSAMDALRMGLAASDLGTGDDAPLPTARRVVAVVPTIVGAYWRYRTGEEPLEPNPDHGHAEHYLAQHTGSDPSAATVRGLETFLATVVEHGMNTSTFAARVVTSAESDLVSAATAAVGALKGTRHGGRLEQVSDLLWAAHDAPSTEAYVRDAVADADTIPGFGHRVYEVRDPRAAVLAATAERFYRETGERDFLDTVRTVETVATEVLARREERHQPRPTVEFYAAALLHGLGVPDALLPATFAVGRVGGWMAHCLEQRDTDHLIRPTARYVGATERTWTPVEDRTGDEPAVLVDRDGTTGLEPVSETLATVSEPNRLEILLALYEADAPLSYSALKSATSITDKGRFNYHLRQLRGLFVSDGDDGYALTEAGETVVHALVRNDGLLDSVTE